MNIWVFGGCFSSVRIYPDQTGHASGWMVAPVGEKQSFIGITTVISSVYLCHAKLAEYIHGQPWQITQPVPSAIGYEMGIGTRESGQKLIANLLSHFEAILTNGRTNPGKQLIRWGFYLIHGGLNYPINQPAPTCMNGGDFGTGTIA